MENVKIKICDIRESRIVKFCEQQGIDFFGIHQIQYPLTNEKKKLVEEIRKITSNIKLVLVTKEEDINKLMEMCLQCKWDYIQLHSKINLEKTIELKNRFKDNRIDTGIISVIGMSELNEYNIEKMSEISDFLLFDSSIRGGTGVRASNELIKRIPKLVNGKKFFIAGGLNDENVLEVIKSCNPYAVDVQSGVEYKIPELKHVKDPDKIRKFSNVVKKELYRNDDELEL